MSTELPELSPALRRSTSRIVERAGLRLHIGDILYLAPGSYLYSQNLLKDEPLELKLTWVGHVKVIDGEPCLLIEGLQADTVVPRPRMVAVHLSAFKTPEMSNRIDNA